jgi:chromate reductase
MKRKIAIINGSASEKSANQKVIDHFMQLPANEFEFHFINLKTLPHFDPYLSETNTPEAVTNFRDAIKKANGILICTPEYIFSIPSGLKNALEWCVSTTVFSGKPIGIITASASGQKGHDELQLIMQTLMAKFTLATTLLIQGIKGKINNEGEITDAKTKNQLLEFSNAFRILVEVH